MVSQEGQDTWQGRFVAAVGDAGKGRILSRAMRLLCALLSGCQRGVRGPLPFQLKNASTRDTLAQSLDVATLHPLKS